MKPSGIEWVGEIPSDWEVKPFFSLGAEVKTLNRDLKEKNLLSLSYGEIVRKDIEANFGLLPESFDGYQIVEKGDLVFRFTDLQNDQKSLRSGVVKEKGIITNAYLGFRPHSIHSEYLNYVMRAYDLQKIFYAMGSGLRQSLTFSDVKKLLIPLPPMVQQLEIVEHLDGELQYIDELITKQRSLVALAQEKHKAVVSNLLEERADEKAIPLKYFVQSLDSRRVPLSAEEREGMQGEYPYYGASGVIDSVDSFLFDETLVLVSEDGANLLMRSSPIAFEAHGKYWVNNHAHILRPLDGLTKYWAARIESMDVSPLITGAAQPKLTADALMNLRVMVPADLNVRAEISRELAVLDEEFSELQSRSNSFVQSLVERRFSLITHSVTKGLNTRKVA